MKLHSFYPNTVYRFRTLNELNTLCSIINAYKSELSNSLQYYLRKYGRLLDIPRLCRALAVPGQLAENFIKTDSKAEQYAAGELYKIQYPINQIVQTLQRHFYFKNDDDNNNLIISNLNKTQKEAIYTDINELAVYS